MIALTESYKNLPCMESTKQSILFHNRSITDIKFHPDGDVFFASSKDYSTSMVDLNGKILGSFERHNGAVSTLDVRGNQLATAGFDLSFAIWDVLTGAKTRNIVVPSVIRGMDFQEEAIYISTDHSMNKECFLGLYDLRAPTINNLAKFDVSTTRLFKSGNTLVFSAVNGWVYKLDLRTNKVIDEARVHRGKITNLRPSACRSFFVSASVDSSVKIIDTDTLETKKQFDCDEPINSACIFRTNDRLVAVGGIDARDVTTTQGKSSFDTCFYDVVTQKKVGSYTTHFGTINAVDVHPTMSYYCSGGEDGSVCLVKMGQDFHNAPFTNFNQ